MPHTIEDPTPERTIAQPRLLRGSWMQTYTGRQFYPLDPQADDIEPLDIAHSLSMQCRYNGHSHSFMSVAEHCVLMSRAVSPAHALWALLHDATETYVGDMIRPLKVHMPDFVAAEDAVMVAVAQRFGIDPVMPAEVREVDTRILLDERAALFPAPAGDWDIHVEPLGVKIQCWHPSEARRQYLARLGELLR